MSNNNKKSSFFARGKHKGQTKEESNDGIDEPTLNLLQEAADRESNGDLTGSLDAYRNSLLRLMKQVGKTHHVVAETFEKVAHVMTKLGLDEQAKHARENANEIYHKLFDSLSRQGKMKDAYIYFSRSKKLEALLEESSLPSDITANPRMMERVSGLRSSTLDSSSNHFKPPRPPSKPNKVQSKTPSGSSLVRPGLALPNSSGHNSNMLDSSRSLTSVATQTSMAGLRKETQAFITKLNGYLDCRRQMDHKYEEVDKATLLAKLKLETHSQGIELSEESERYKEHYRQMSITHEGPVQDIDELYAAAKAAQPIFMEKIQFLVKQVCGECELDEADVKVYFADLKKQERALEKANDDYGQRSPGPGVSWLYDIVRGSVEFNSATHIEAFIRHLYEENDIHIVKAKNRFEKPSLTGYRDMCFQFRLGSEGHSHICEVQVHHKVILALDKAIGSHAFYEFFRSYFSGAVGSLQERLKDLELISDGALVDESFLDNFLQKCSFKDADRLERLAKLFDKNLCEYDAAIQTYERLAEVLAEEHGPTNYFVAGTYSTIASIMHVKGQNEEALDLYDRSARLCAQSLGALHPAIASMLNNMASVLATMDRLDEGFATYGNAAKIYQYHLGNPNTTFDRDHLKKSLAGAYHNQAGILFDQSKLDESLKLHEQALEMKIELLGEINDSVGLSYNSIGEVLEAQDKLEEAMEYYEKSLDIYKRTLGHSHSSVANCLHNIAELLHVQDKCDQALDMFEMVVAIKKKNYNGEEHSSVAHTYLSIASVKMDQSKYDEAIEYCKKALEIKKATLGEDHSSFSTVYVSMAKIYFSKGKVDEAMAMIERKALRIATNALGREHHSLIEMYSIMGHILNEQQQYDESLTRFKQALALVENIFGEEHTNAATIYTGMATTLKDQGKFERAMEMYERSLEIDRKTFGDEHSSVIIDHTRIANLMAKQGNVEGATETFKKVLDWYEARPGLLIYSHIGVLLSIGRMYSFVDKLDDAMEHLQRALDLCLQSRLHDEYITSSVHGNIATIFRYQGKMDQAMEAYEQSMSINRKIHGEDHSSIASLKNDMAIIMVGRGNFEGATANYKRCLGFYEQRPGEHSLSYIATLHDVADMYRDLEQFDLAMEYCQRALTTCQETGFEELLMGATVQDEIGKTLMAQGLMEAALEKHQEALAIKQKIHGEDHISIMNGYCAIANVLVEQGDFEGAIENFQRSLDWFGKHIGMHTIAFARTLGMVSRMYITQGKYDKAIECCQQALNLCSENGFDDMYIAGMVHSLLGWAQKLSGNLAEARKSYREALRIYRTIYGHDHLALGGVNNDIGELFILQEDFKKAKKYLDKAKEIYSSRVGGDTALVAEVMMNIGILKHKEGEPKEALDLLQSAQKIFNETAHTWSRKELRKKTKRTIVEIKKELGVKKEKKKKKSSSNEGGGWKKVTTSS